MTSLQEVPHFFYSETPRIRSLVLLAEIRLVTINPPRTVRTCGPSREWWTTDTFEPHVCMLSLQNYNSIRLSLYVGPRVHRAADFVWIRPV